jgi:hypothetical protein
MSEDTRTGANPATAESKQESRQPSAAAVVGSVLAAAFGVQSSKKHQQDFSAGNYRHYIIGGIVFTVLFVATLVVVVRMVIGGQ